MKAVLTYHSIDDSGSPISVSVREFDAHVGWLTSGRVRVLPLDALVRDSGAGPAVAVTFDDGLVSAGEAASRLVKAGIVPTIFVVTGRAGASNAWGGRTHPGIPNLPLMGWRQMEALAAMGVRFEAHSRTHAALTTVSDTQLDDELGGARMDLHTHLGVEARHVAYPYGAVDRRVAGRARAWFAYGYTTDLRGVASQDEPLLLPRLDMYYYKDVRRLAGWGQPAFMRRLARLRARRWIRSWIGRYE